MERVIGIGGFFFRAQNPSEVGLWYKEHLGIDLPPSTYDELPWQPEAGPTAFAAFPEATEYFGPARKAGMINLRVRDLDARVAQLRAAGIKVEIDREK